MASNTLASLIVISVINGIAVSSTCFRLVHRTVKHRLWWDEFWALVSLVFVTCQWVASIDIPPSGNEMSVVWRVSFQVMYNFSLWTARMSLAVTIVRICPVGKMRTLAKGVAVAFCLCCAGLTVRRTITCATQPDFNTFCPYENVSAAIETVFDIFADGWLIGAPIYMVYHMRLPSRHLRMLVAIFMLNILTTVACIVHAVFRQLKLVPQAILTASIQSATSLFVCNLLVLITFLYRKVRGGEEATSISDQTETVTHSMPHQPYRSARTVPSLRHRLPPGARIEMTNVSAVSCRDCAFCKYIQERLSTPSSRRRRSTSSLRTPPHRRIDSKVAMGKDPGRVPSEKSLNVLFPCNCHLSPSSTFPDLPVCELHKDRDPRRVPSEKSITSLYPCMCNLSPSSTFPDIPVCPEHCHLREHRERERESSERVPSSPFPSLASLSRSMLPADGHASPTAGLVATLSQITTDSGFREDPVREDLTRQTDGHLDPPVLTEPPSEPPARDPSMEDSSHRPRPENRPEHSNTPHTKQESQSDKT